MTAQKINIGLALGGGGAMNNFETLQNLNLLQVLGRAEQITSTRLGELKAEKADITIEPDTMDVFWAEFNKIDQLIQNGKNETDRLLWDIKTNLKKKKGIHRKVSEFIELISEREQDQVA